MSLRYYWYQTSSQNKLRGQKDFLMQLEKWQNHNRSTRRNRASLFPSFTCNNTLKKLLLLRCSESHMLTLSGCCMAYCLCSRNFPEVKKGVYMRVSPRDYLFALYQNFWFSRCVKLILFCVYLLVFLFYPIRNRPKKPIKIPFYCLII